MDATKKEQFNLPDLLITAGYAPRTAKALAWLILKGKGNVISKEIERGADLRQPEVYYAMNRLIDQGWVKEIKDDTRQKFDAITLQSREVANAIQRMKADESKETALEVATAAGKLADTAAVLVEITPSAAEWSKKAKEQAGKAAELAKKGMYKESLKNVRAVIVSCNAVKRMFTESNKKGRKPVQYQFLLTKEKAYEEIQKSLLMKSEALTDLTLKIHSAIFEQGQPAPESPATEAV